ncbi:MAG: PhnD/SsuA/transferrin family substrate-binding protein [Rubrivivax sp.]|nr:PhnD/SsuA/transferrin family substrate-binding protein [Rubrivivax sp.]
MSPTPIAPLNAWRALRRAAGFAIAAQVATMTAAAPLNVLVNPGDQGEQSRAASYLVLRAALADALREAKVGEANWIISTDATADLATTRSQMHDIFVAPAHVVSSALRHGYVPLVGNPKGAQAVIVAMKDKGMKTLADTAGKRLGLPLQDSVVTYLVRGELNAANTSLKSHYRSVVNMRYQDALLVCLQVRECDVVGVEKAVFDRWAAAGEPVMAVMQSRPAPGLSVAMRQSIAASGATARSLQPVLLRALTGSPSLVKSGMDQLATVETRDYEYVSTLGYFTPRQLPGAKVVDAGAVAELLGTGAIYIDTRTEAEYRAGHVPQARLVPYVEKSAKDTDFDARLDSFDLSKLPQDKAAPIIFACNGAECWKSYKASLAAVKAGYRQVHWFRGGFPEWRNASRQVAVAAKP